MQNQRLLSKSLKTEKSDKAGKGYLTTIMYLAPHRLSGHNVCPNASQGCIASCLNLSGRGFYDRVQQSRIHKTRYFYDERSTFLRQLRHEIKGFERLCNHKGVKPAIRLNGTSDLPWEKLIDMQEFPNVQFYDYTKNYRRMMEFCNNNLPPNYYLTFSRSEHNEDKCYSVLCKGGNVAVVFPSGNFPLDWKGVPVYNGDETDLRFLDPFGVCGLKAKGKARRDMSGFVVRN